jgi:hypothetical protein
MARGPSRYEEGEPREVPIVSRDRKRWVTVYTSDDAALVGNYWQELDVVLQGLRDWDWFQDRWRGTSIAGLPFETDPDALELLALEGRLVIDEFYRDTN